MPLSEGSIVGHKKQLLDPERQIGLLRKHLRGEKTPYDTPASVIWAARDAIEKAMHIVYTTGIQKGYRQYNDSEIKKMRAEIERLEKLLERKNAGEDIKDEIDSPADRKETDGSPKNAKTSHDVPEILEIETMIDEALGLRSNGKKTEASERFGEAIKMIAQVKLEGINVSGVQNEINTLREFFQNQ